MNKLMKDIIHTADSFVENFSQNSVYSFIEKGAMNYSIESLEVVDRLLEEISDYELEEDPFVI